LSVNRGAWIQLNGNEAGGTGAIAIAAGNVAGGTINFYTAGLAQRGQIHNSGGFSWGNTTDPGAAAFQVANRVLLTSGVVGMYSGGIAGALTVGLVSTGLQMTAWPVSAAAANALVGDGDVLRRSTSVRAAKRDIETINTEEALRVVRALTGVTYRSALPDDADRVWSGFVAEDVDAIAPTLATYDKDGRVQSVAYDRVVAYLIPAFKALEARLARAEARLP
jgi:hypothetical protein